MALLERLLVDLEDHYKEKLLLVVLMVIAEGDLVERARQRKMVAKVLFFPLKMSN